MKNILALLFLISLLPFSSVKGEVLSFSTPSFELHKLEFSNRARCAADSEKPSESAFLMINNVDPARAVYRLALARGIDTRSTTKMGIDVFRTSVLRLMNLIHNRIMNRELPLLPAEMTKEGRHVPLRYARVMKSCKLGEYCPALDQYVADLWSIASSKMTSGSKFLKYYEIDNFHSQQNYIWSNDVHRNHREQTQLSCAYLKKFSPLQANLYGTQPTGAALRAIGEAALKQQDYLAHCDDLEAMDDLQVAVYQLDLPEFKNRQWDQHGHDYWNSMRLYLSWAYRFAPEMEQMAYPFAHLFRSVALEDAIILTPNGCKSLAPVACDNDRLAVNSIREFSRRDYRTQALNLDVLRNVPMGAQETLLNSPIPPVNTDILDLADHSSATSWMNQFRENMSATRNHHRAKLISAFTQLNLITSHFSAEELFNSIDSQFQALFSSPLKKVDFDNTQLNELYYLCSEFSFSQHDTWSIIKGQIDILKDYKVLNDIARGVSGQDVQAYHQFLATLAERLNQNCYALNQRSLWDDQFTLDKEGFSPWYVDKVYENKFPSKHDSLMREYLKDNSAFLRLKTKLDNTDSYGDVICAHPSHCARKIAQGVIDIYAAAQYASALWGLDQKIKTPDLFNPYAERVACEIYDPWYKTKSAIFNLVWDLGQGAISTISPGMIYTSAQLNPRTVTSFRQLIENGEIHFDRSIKPESIIAGLSADLGPLMGVPCAVSVNRTTNVHDYMVFTGVSVGACQSDQNHNLFVQSGSEINDNQSRMRSSCVSCTLNFDALSGSLAFLSSNVGPVYFFVRGMYRLYQGLKDPFNIPRSWDVYPQDAAETLLSFGEIPNHCIRNLRSGKSCLKNSCEQAVSDAVKRQYPRLPNYFEKFEVRDSGNGKAYMRGCDQPITFRTSKHNNNDSSHEETCSVSRLQIPRNCFHKN